MTQFKTLYRHYQDKQEFVSFGFSNHVSITINTLVESDIDESDIDGEDQKRYEFEMLQLKQISMNDLLPNKVSQSIIQKAGERIDIKEEGPVEYKTVLLLSYIFRKMSCQYLLHQDTKKIR